ncbi:MAG TPA: hypothetical protein VMF14_11015 [Solirubrobacteraceae bacterium]|nr:hypothetical protein [Solirubrobacteraceae bacterium]
MRVLEAGQVLGGPDPALQPVIVVALTPAERLPRVNGLTGSGSGVPGGLGRVGLGCI